MDTNRRRTIGALSAAAALYGAPLRVAAQAWPAKPLRAVVGFPAGGVVDVAARVMSERAAHDLGQPIVIENRLGAGGNIAVESVHAAPRDGYSWLISSNFLFVNPALDSALKWRFEDFEPVARFAMSPSFLLVPSDASYSTLSEWIDHAKRQPAPVQMGDGGPGTSQTMAMRMLEREAGIRLESVYYKGAPQMLQDIIGGQLPISMIPATVAIPAIKSGRVKALVTSGDRRSPALPNVPTMAESGFPNATSVSWFGVHVLAGTPPDIVRRAARAIEVACANADVRTRLQGGGGEEAFLPADRFSDYLGGESKRWLGLLAGLRKPGG
jgi:tripartite-type tricarboxylate transporter receptor subunit TctC